MKDDDSLPDDVPGLEYAGTTATIRLRRPRHHNRIDPADVPVLRDHVADILRHDEVRVVILSGFGDETFSSGYTLQAIAEQLDRGFEELLDAVEQLPMPTICALNGSVYGGATDLALCCDVRIGVHGSRMLMPAARFGLHYYPGGMRRYVAQLGLAQAKRLFLTAQPIDAAEMLRIGFLTELAAPEQLWDKVGGYVAAIAACAPGAVASMKRQLNALANDFPAGALGRDEYERSLRSDELKRRIPVVDRHH
jgi:enoyl-CoA hydratase/carnithine racemase